MGRLKRKATEPVVYKYPNRKLYSTETRQYIKVPEAVQRILSGERVLQRPTDADVTDSVLLGYVKTAPSLKDIESRVLEVKLALNKGVSNV